MIKSLNSDEIRSKYKSVRNLVRSRMRKDTEVYVSSLSGTIPTHPRYFGGGLILLVHNYVTEDIQKTEEFNAHFSSVFTVDDGSDIFQLRSSLSFCPSIIQSIEFNVEDVCSELENLDPG